MLSSRRAARLAFVLAAAPLALPVAAQTDTYRLPLGSAVDLALGGASATAQGAGSLLSTPAAAAGGRREVAVGAMRWSDGGQLTQGRLSAVLPLGALPLRPSVGVALGAFVRPEDGAAAGASRNEVVAALTLAAVAGPVRAGAGVKGVRASYQGAMGEGTSARGVTVDAGAQVHLAASALVVGVALRHFGPASSGALEAEPLSEVALGASWQALTLRAEDGGPPLARLRLVGELQQRSVAASTASAGAEVVGFDRFAARIGYRAPTGDANEDARWSFGLGYTQDRVRADVAVLPSPLGNDAALLLTLATRF